MTVVHIICMLFFQIVDGLLSQLENSLRSFSIFAAKNHSVWHIAWADAQMALFSFCICCLKCLMLILMLCLYLIKKHADMKIRAEKVEKNGSYNLFVILVQSFRVQVFSCLLPSFPKSFQERHIHSTPSAQIPVRFFSAARQNTLKREVTEVLSTALYSLPE